MNFADESYVRLYVRDTKTWLRLGFAGQCCLMFLLRKLDRAGVLDGIEDLHPDVSLITGVPDHIVEIGMPRLLESGVLELHGTCLVMPNFIEAQSATRTDKARQKDARDKRLAETRLVTIRESSVTRRDETVTETEAAQQPVTPSIASPSSAIPNQAALPERARELPSVPGLQKVPSVSRVPTLPSAEPPKEFLDEALMGGVSRAQAISTWKHYWGAGLPERGVEKLYPWLTQRAIERQNQVARAPALRRVDAQPESLNWRPDGRARAYTDRHGGNFEVLLTEFYLTGEYRECTTTGAADKAFAKFLKRKLNPAAEAAQ